MKPTMLLCIGGPSDGGWEIGSAVPGYVRQVISTDLVEGQFWRHESLTASEALEKLLDGYERQ